MMKLCLLSAALGVNLDPPSGTFCGSLLGIIKENATFYPDGATFDYYNEVKIAKIQVACQNEKYVWDGSGTIDISADLKNSSDCMAQATAADPKSSPTFKWDGKVIASKNAYGTLKMKPC